MRRGKLSFIITLMLCAAMLLAGAGQASARTTIYSTFKTPKVGTYYSDYIYVSGGTPSYTWTKISGTVPTGLRLTYSSSYCYLKGTPTRPGTYTFKLRARDRYGIYSVKTFTLTVPRFSFYSTFRSGQLNKSYSDYVWIDYTTGTPATPMNIRVSGSVPGLSFSRSGRYVYLRGTPTRAGTFRFTLSGTDRNGVSIIPKTFTVTITRPTVTINSTFKSAKVGTYYSDYVYATGGSSSRWQKVSGNLPSGMTLYQSGSYAYLKGTPETAGTYYFTLKATDSSGSYATKSFVVYVYKPTIYINSTFKSAKVGSYYSDYVYASGGSSYRWYKYSGTIPSGMTLYLSGSYAYLKGTPETAGTYYFSLRAIDTSGSYTTKYFTLYVTRPSVTINYTFKSGRVGTYYSDYVYATGGSSYRWYKYSGTVPYGMSLYLSGSYAYLRGTPSSSGTYYFSLRVYDSSGAYATKYFSVYIAPRYSYYYSSDGEATTASSSPKVTAAVPGGAEPAPTTTNATTKNLGSGSKLSLKVQSDDVVSVGEEGYEDIVEVEAGKPVTFVIDESVGENDEVDIYINDKLLEDEKIFITEENKFTLPASMIASDFRIYFKVGSSISEELHISVVENAKKKK